MLSAHAFSTGCLRCGEFLLAKSLFQDFCFSPPQAQNDLSSNPVSLPIIHDFVRCFDRLPFFLPRTTLKKENDPSFAPRSVAAAEKQCYILTSRTDSAQNYPTMPFVNSSFKNPGPPPPRTESFREIKIVPGYLLLSARSSPSPIPILLNFLQKL